MAQLRSHRSAAGVIILLAAVALVTACDRNAPATAIVLGATGLVHEHVSAASDGDSTTALVWSATSEFTGSNILASVSHDAGLSFSEPVRVNLVDGQANVNGEQPPRVAVVREPDGSRSIVALWTVKGAQGTALVSAQSSDGGRTFGPHDVGARRRRSREPRLGVDGGRRRRPALRLVAGSS